MAGQTATRVNGVGSGGGIRMGWVACVAGRTPGVYCDRESVDGFRDGRPLAPTVSPVKPTRVGLRVFSL